MAFVRVRDQNAASRGRLPPGNAGDAARSRAQGGVIGDVVGDGPRRPTEQGGEGRVDAARRAAAQAEVEDGEDEDLSQGQATTRSRRA